MTRKKWTGSLVQQLLRFHWWRDQFNIELRRLRSSGTGLAGLVSGFVELNIGGLGSPSPFSDSELEAVLMLTI
jgi:hypothetical protein